MKGFTLAPEAVEDLDGIWEYIADDNPDAADRFLTRLYDNIYKLAEMPGIGHIRADLAGDRPLLFWPVGSYLILYRANRKPIEIVGIAHGKRDIPSFLKRREI